MATPLYIPPSKKWKGLTVFCYKCKTNVSETCKETEKPLQRCPFGEKHAFKVYSYIPRTKIRKTKKLDTRDVNNAIKLAIEFDQEVKGTVAPRGVITENKKISNVPNQTPRLLIHALSRYVGFLNNENVPTQLKEERSTDYVKDIERKLKYLVESLKKKGYDTATFQVDDLNDKVVGDVYDHLKEENKFSPRTFNKHFSYYTAFLKWFSEEYYPVRGWFARVKKESVNSEPEAITQDENEALLKIITRENGIQKYESGVKEYRNFYRPYLKDAFRLALQTGSRREELINLKFNGINEENEGSGYIKVENYKVNHIQKRKTEEQKKYIYIPLTASLKELLNELGYEKYKGTDNYILAPEIDSKRNKVLSDLLSRAFTHYYKQLNTGRNLTFKSYRKTYITNLKIYMGKGIKERTGHSTEDVIEKYYLARKELAKSAKDFEVFPKENRRKNELEKVRSHLADKHQKMEVAK